MTKRTLIHGASRIVGLADNDPLTRIELMPIGPVRLKDARGLVGQVVDASALIARSLEQADGAVLPIDFDHGMDGRGARDGRAAGWITSLDIEGERIWAHVDWTPLGAAALRDKTYRFISPTFTVNEKTKEVDRIIRAGLTNNPALRELAQVASSQEEDTMPEWLKNLARKLGLDADADEAVIAAAAEAAVDQAGHAASIVTAAGLSGELTEAAATAITAKITAAGNDADPDPAKYVPITAVAELTAQVASLQKQIDGDTSERLVTAAMEAGKLPPALEAWGREYAEKDPEGFRTWTASAPVLVSGKPVVSSTAPIAGDPDGLTREERTVCAATGVSPEAFLATKQGKPSAAQKKEA